MGLWDLKQGEDIAQFVLLTIDKVPFLKFTELMNKEEHQSCEHFTAESLSIV